MGKNKIVAALAGTRYVERLIESITHSPLDEDTKDLAQMVYVVLLEYDEDKIKELWEKNQMRFFVVRVILNQFRSTHSPFHTQIRKFRMMSQDDLSVTGITGNALESIREEEYEDI